MYTSAPQIRSQSEFVKICFYILESTLNRNSTTETGVSHLFSFKVSEHRPKIVFPFAHAYIKSLRSVYAYKRLLFLCPLFRLVSIIIRIHAFDLEFCSFDGLCQLSTCFCLTNQTLRINPSVCRQSVFVSSWEWIPCIRAYTILILVLKTLLYVCIFLYVCL